MEGATKQDLILRAVLSLFLVFVVGKFLSVILKGLWDSRSRKARGGGNLEMMIERRKSELRSGMASGKESKQGSKSSGPQGDLKALYASAAQKAAKAGDKEKQKDFNKVLKLLDQIQWGDAPEWKEVQKRLKQKAGIKVEVSEITKHFRLLTRSFKKDQLPGMETILSRLASNLFYKQFLHELKEGEDTLARRLALRWSMEPSSVLKGAISLGLKLGGAKPSKAYKEAMAGTKTLQNQEKIFSKLGQWSLGELESKIKEEAFVIDALRTLPEPGHPQDRDWALVVFSLTEKANMEAVKKRYKLLATKVHPDRLGGRGLSDSQLKKAGDNFTKIQQAYAILKKE